MVMENSVTNEKKKGLLSLSSIFVCVTCLFHHSNSIVKKKQQLLLLLLLATERDG
jgi:hypothetical protein